MFKKGVFITNGLIMLAILGVVFLSQLSYIKGTSKTFKFPLLEKTGGFFKNSPLNGANDLFKASTYSNVGNTISQEAAKRGEMAKNEIDTQKNNLEKNSISATKKFLAEKILNLIGVKPEDLQTSQSSSVECK